MARSWLMVTLVLRWWVKLLFGKGRAGPGIRDDDIAAITAMISVHRAQQNLHHCQKSTSSQYYRLTRLHFRSIDSTDFSTYRSTRSISRSTGLFSRADPWLWKVRSWVQRKATFESLRRDPVIFFCKLYHSDVLWTWELNGIFHNV